MAGRKDLSEIDFTLALSQNKDVQLHSMRGSVELTGWEPGDRRVFHPIPRIDTFFCELAGLKDWLLRTHILPPALRVRFSGPKCSAEVLRRGARGAGIKRRAQSSPPPLPSPSVPFRSPPLS